MAVEDRERIAAHRRIIFYGNPTMKKVILTGGFGSDDQLAANQHKGFRQTMDALRDKK